MVDLDVQAQSFAEIWGWGVRVGNWFEGDFLPSPFQFPWLKMGPGHDTEDGYGAAYTSVLTNITWLDKENDFVKDVLKYKPERLSIHFNMERYTKDPASSNFTWGHVTGVIGVGGGLSPPFFVGHGRMLRPRVEGVQSAPFVVDTWHRRYEHVATVIPPSNWRTGVLTLKYPLIDFTMIKLNTYDYLIDLPF